MGMNEDDLLMRGFGISCCDKKSSVPRRKHFAKKSQIKSGHAAGAAITSPEITLIDCMHSSAITSYSRDKLPSQFEPREPVTILIDLKTACGKAWGLSLSTSRDK